jgi:uncharacterized protein (TIGR03545 family)
LLDVHLGDEFNTRLEQVGKWALRQFARAAQQNLDSLQSELISVQLLNELAARWPADVQKLEQRALNVRSEIAQLSDEVQAGASRPARAALSISERITQIEQLRAEIENIRHEIDHLVEQVGRDRIAIEVAQRHDRETIERKFEPRPLNEQSISEYLLGDELSAQTCELIAWIKLARRYWPGEVALPESERSLGTDIVFPGVPPMPRALVQRMFLNGTFQKGNAAVNWQGEILNLTTDPAVVGQPMIVRAQTSGPRALVLEATLDRTDSVPRDRIVLSIPRMELPQRKLGTAEEFSIIVQPGSMLVWAEMELTGENLRGRVLLQQKQLQLKPEPSPAFSPRVCETLASRLSHVDELKAQVVLAGTLDKPSWQLHSNLGPQVTATLTDVFRAELAALKHETTHRLDQELAQRQAAFDQEIAAQRQRLSERLELVQAEVAQARDLVAGRIQLPGGFKLPEINPFGLR